VHPEQYSDTLSSDQIKQLRTSILHICQTAVDVLGDASKFPDEWLFNHRWGKGKKDAPTTLPNGAKITHVTVGGRTSCVVPSVQKKTGAVAGDVKEESSGEEADGAGKEGESTERKVKKGRGGAAKKRKTAAAAEEVVKGEAKANGAKRRKADASPTKDATKDGEEPAASMGRRRSGRTPKTKDQ
jgi:formamidopyrimidine-DNA glycosylase